MGKFKGWTSNSILKLKAKQSSAIKEQLLPKIHPINYVKTSLEFLGIKSKLEYRFDKNRRFRFDLAIPKYKIAVEYEGGIYTKGRHVRALGYTSDIEKYNLAVMKGWRLIRFTVKDMKEYDWHMNIAKKILTLIKTTNDHQ